VGERKKEEHARALARLAELGLRAKGAGAGASTRVNDPPKSGPILAGTWLPFAYLFYHFESVIDFTRGILGTCNRLGFWDAKNPSGSFL
jgi:hypothetical protein